MKLNLKYYILIFFILKTISISSERKNIIQKNKNDRLKKYPNQRNLQYDTYNTIDIFEFSFYDNQMDLIINYEPQIPYNISVGFELIIHTYNDSDIYWDYPEMEINLNANNISNKYTVLLDNLSINFLEFTEISLFNFKCIDDNYNYSCNFVMPQTKLNIINETKEIFDENNKYIYTIYITNISYYRNYINLIIYCEPEPSEDINMVITLEVLKNNETGYWFGSLEEVEIIIKNRINIFNSVLECSNINESIYIAITKVNIENNEKSHCYYIYFPTSPLYLDKEVYEYYVTYQTIKQINVSKEYYINITEVFLNDDTILNFNITNRPQIIENITLILLIQLEKYNESGDMTYEYIELKTMFNVIKTINSFSEKLNITGYGYISISSANVEHNDWYNKYYIDYPYVNLYYNENIYTDSIYNSTNISAIEPIRTVIDDSTRNSTTYSTTQSSGDSNNNQGNEQNDEESGQSNPVISSKKSSSKLSIGAIIGIIGGILGVIGVIAGIIICIKKNNNNNNNKIGDTNIIENFHSSSSNIANDTGEVIIKDPKENMRTFIFQTQKQDKEIISIESDKSMKELRKIYLEKINHKELIEDKDIFFLFNGKHFSINTDGLIKDFFKDYKNPNLIIVVDNEDKI